MSTLAQDPRLAMERGDLRGLIALARRRIRQGEIGSLPVVLGLVIIAIIFQSLNSHFLTPLNLTFLFIQISAVGTIAVGVVLVLLLGEIDLSVGAVSGVCAAVMAVLSVRQGLAGPLAVLAGVIAGAGIGALQGWWITKLRVPSFIVTLAGLLGWQGVLLYLLGTEGTINISDPFITGIVNTRLPVAVGWVIGVALVGGVGAATLMSRARRQRTGLTLEPLTIAVLRLTVIAAGVLGAVALMSVNRAHAGLERIAGVPTAVVVLLAFVVGFDLLTRRTRFGRYVYAVGGNAEAARRAGINVDLIRITVFVLSSTLAACGGIVAASRLYAVNQSSGSGDLLLNAIAAAVIGGTSLFGGRGYVWSALLGALVIGSIANGMNLLALSSSVKFMITGAVLLLAVTIDAISRRGRQAAGRA